MTATKLGLYNGALVEIGAAPLSTVTDVTKSRYTLDSVYDDVLASCLASGQWGFATRTVQLDADTGITPAFGYTYVFAKPTDWMRTIGISGDENFTQSLLDYIDQQGQISAWVTPIFFAYISNSTDWGLNLSLWPQSFSIYVQVALAEAIVTAITQNAGDKDRLQRLTVPKAKRTAMNEDAMNRPAKFMSMNSWNRARGFTSSLNGTRRGL